MLTIEVKGSVDLADKEVTISCPKCSQKLTKKIGWLTNNSHLSCDCGANIRLDTEEFGENIRQLQKTLDDFKNLKF